MERLLHRLRARIQSGEWTERGLARRAGLSQPHVHNLLKGIRFLTAESADALLGAVSEDIARLMAEDGRAAALAGSVECRAGVALMAALAGPGHEWTDRALTTETVPFPSRALLVVDDPAAVRVAADQEMGTSGGVVLIDRSEGARRMLAAGQAHLVRLGGEARLRWVRAGRNCLYAPTEANLARPREWQILAAGPGRGEAIIGAVWRDSFDHLREAATSR